MLLFCFWLQFFKSKMYLYIAALPPIVISSLVHEYMIGVGTKAFIPSVTFLYCVFGSESFSCLPVWELHILLYVYIFPLITMATRCDVCCKNELSSKIFQKSHFPNTLEYGYGSHDIWLCAGVLHAISLPHRGKVTTSSYDSCNHDT